MSSSLNRIRKNVIEAMQSANKQGTSAYDSVAEVRRVEGDTAWVHIAGGVDETPVKLTIAAKAGDMVQVRVGGGRAWITGNASAPPTDDKTAITAKSLANIAGNRAKTAQKTANQAQTVAENAQASADNAQADIDSIKKRVVIGDDSVDIVDSTGKLLASYGDVKIELGKNAVSSIIEMCGGMARVSARYGGLTTIYSHNGGYQTTLDYDFNETTFKSKVGSNYGDYDFIYSGGVWECSYSGNNAGYVQVNLSDYGITLKTTSVNEYAGIAINYWDGSEATFINTDTTKPSRKLILGLAESGTSDNTDYANIEIERSKEGGVEHSKINLLTVHDEANFAGVHLDNGDIELNCSGEVLINQYNVVQRLKDMLCTEYPETLTVKAGTFTNNGCSATLVGNSLYLYLKATAKAAISAGNIANQTMLTITFTDSKIATLYSVSGSGGSSGPNSQMLFTGASSGGQHTITVTLAAIAQNIAKGGEINAKVSIPCVLDWDAY